MQALSIKNLQKVYPDGLEALKGIDLTVEEGDFFAMLGPNGAGKSTTIGIITSLVNKTVGEITVFGHDLDTASAAAKACLGLVPQEYNFNQFEKVIDIVLNQAGYYGLSRKIGMERAEYYLGKLDLWDKRNTISRSLSGGMKRRLMIARGLIHKPKMLILDEPTAGVDIELRRSTWEFLQEINNSGTTIILTTHYLEEAEYLCNGIAIIDKGEIVEKTTVKKLLSRMQKEAIILDLSREIENVPVLQDYDLTLIDNKTIEIVFPKTKSLNKLFHDLSTVGLEIVSMRNKANRLEELFLNLIQNNNVYKENK